MCIVYPSNIYAKWGKKIHTVIYSKLKQSISLFFVLYQASLWSAPQSRIIHTNTSVRIKTSICILRLKFSDVPYNLTSDPNCGSITEFHSNYSLTSKVNHKRYWGFVPVPHSWYTADTDISPKHQTKDSEHSRRLDVLQAHPREFMFMHSEP